MKKKLLIMMAPILSHFYFAQVGINTENPQGIFHIDAAKNNVGPNAPAPNQQYDDFIVSATGTVGVGTITPDASAILELNVSNLPSGQQKGFLAPRVALSSVVDKTTIPSPATGLLVYNLGTIPTFNYVGYVFWNGTEWRSFNNSSIALGTVGAISCNSVTLTPSIYTANVRFSGTMNVPYTGSNGGIYDAQSIGPINGLTATLTAGNFNSGSGTLSYSITGTPSVTSPTTTTFNINIGGQSCAAVIGQGDVIQPGSLVFHKSNLSASLYGSGDQYTGNQDIGWLSYYDKNLPILGGKLRLDGYFYGSSTGTSNQYPFNPRLVNITGQPVKLWFSAITNVDRYNGANIAIASNGWVNLDNGIYLNNGANQSTSNAVQNYTGTNSASGGGQQEVLTMDLALDDIWYRVYYFPYVDNNNTPLNTTDDIRTVFVSVQRLY